MLTVKANRKTGTIRLPDASRGMLARGNTFIFSQSGDTILLKQVQEKPWPAEMGTSGKPVSLEEIDAVVHSVRIKHSGR
jgi:ASC-1-like (ASCH) protein